MKQIYYQVKPDYLIRIFSHFISHDFFLSYVKLQINNIGG
jgi:hypothetical protein